MAGRSPTLRARAIASLTTALALVASAVAPSGAAVLSEPPEPPIVVTQTDTTASIPFGRRDGAPKPQKIAQTFVAPEETVELTSLSLLLAGEDRNAVVEIYEVGEAPPLGTLLRSLTVPVDHRWGDPGSGWIRTRLSPAIAVQPGTRYSFVLKAERRRDSMATAGGGDRYTGGEAWCFCPTWSDGGIDYSNQQWQDMGADGLPTDVSFKLRFRPAA